MLDATCAVVVERLKEREVISFILIHTGVFLTPGVASAPLDRASGGFSSPERVMTLPATFAESLAAADDQHGVSLDALSRRAPVLLVFLRHLG